MVAFNATPIDVQTYPTNIVLCHPLSQQPSTPALVPNLFGAITPNSSNSLNDIRPLASALQGVDKKIPIFDATTFCFLLVFFNPNLR